MGICWSARIKSESTLHSGRANSKLSTTNGCEMSSSAASKLPFVPPTPRTEGEILQSSNLKSFSFNDLNMATRNFRPDSVVGGGSFGSVFKGWIDENTYTAARPGTGLVIAVKKLHQESLQGHEEWLAEVNYLGQFAHPHLVKLIGFCLEDDHRLLVYEFLSRGSLENHLFRRGSYFQPLPWGHRLKVALGAAKGLAFLHSSDPQVIYRDFKTSSILLDSKYNAKLSDFGLAKNGPADDMSHASTRVMGTYGYAAPEYLATGHLTAKSDVYSYGVVLLELLAGRRAIDKNLPNGEHKLVEWARPYLANKRKVFRIMDNRLEGQYTIDLAQRVATLALRCISLEPRLRPSMTDVVEELEQLQDSKTIENNGSRTHRANSISAIRNTNAAFTGPSSARLQRAETVI